MSALDLTALSALDVDEIYLAADETYGHEAAHRANDASFDYADLYRTNRGKLIFRPGGVYWDPTA